MSKLKPGKTMDQSYGIEAQKQDIQRYIELHPGEIVGVYEERETGTNKVERPELKKAIIDCQQQDATLIVAKLDRLSRNVNFTSALMDSKIPFVCCDNPHATEFTINILSAVAQQEAKTISARVKAGLEIAKQRGVKLGAPKSTITDKTREASAKARAERAMNDPNNIKAAHVICISRKNGDTFKKIAEKLNEKGFLTSKKNKFGAVTVYLLFKKFCSQE